VTQWPGGTVSNPRQHQHELNNRDVRRSAKFVFGKYRVQRSVLRYPCSEACYSRSGYIAPMLPLLVLQTPGETCFVSFNVTFSDRMELLAISLMFCGTVGTLKYATTTSLTQYCDISHPIVKTHVSDAVSLNTFVSQLVLPPRASLKSAKTGSVPTWEFIQSLRDNALKLATTASSDSRIHALGNHSWISWWENRFVCRPGNGIS
jgi:hypothetical protein